LPGPFAAPPIAVMGMHSAVLGLGEAARLQVRALEEAGFAAATIDVTAELGHGPTLNIESTLDVDAAGLIFSQINPPELLTLTAIHGADYFGRGRHIGLWAWETEDIPAYWRDAFPLVDELWAPSTFSAEAFAKAAPSRVSVRTIPYPMQSSAAGKPDRARFGIAPDTVVVLAAADARSSLARKNPMGALEAFARGGAGAVLVLKLVGETAAPDLVAALRRRAAAIPNVRIIDDQLDRQGMADLVVSSDIVMSLHRAEGYGLIMAEAMQMGKAVIGTAYSANLDFMNENNSALVSYTRTPIVDPQRIYKTGYWAEPDIEHAAALLAELIASAERRATLGQAAAVSLDRTAWARDWNARVEDAIGFSNA
jgi:glycosyltransferase involved in cell wall biosynthesis